MKNKKLECLSNVKVEMNVIISNGITLSRTISNRITSNGPTSNRNIKGSFCDTFRKSINPKCNSNPTSFSKQNLINNFQEKENRNSNRVVLLCCC